ncbi:MAG: CHASE3 domain-containing protein, partial [Hyphomonadaceae bacterium]
MKKLLSAMANAETHGNPPRAMLLGLGMMVGAMAVVLGLAAVSAFQRDERQRMVEHTLGVQQAITRSLSLLQDAETGQRGYLLTNDINYLEPYLNAAGKLTPQLDELAVLVADNPQQEERVAQLKSEAAERLKIIDQTLVEARRGQKGAAVSIMREGSGKAVMDRIRAVAGEME